MSDRKTRIRITEEPQKPPFSDYDLLFGYGIDSQKNIYELVFTDTDGKAGKLESVKNVFTNKHLDPAFVEILRKGKN